MKKVLIAALIAGFSLSATAAETIRFATEASYPPFESIDANNQIVGFDVDLAQALCKEIDATCTFSNQAFDSLIPSLKFRRVEAVMAGMDITPEREKQVLFTTPYYDNSALFVGQQGKYTSVDQLKGKKVGAKNGTASYTLLEKNKAKYGYTLKSFDEASTMYDSLNSGSIYALMDDEAVLKYAIQQGRKFETPIPGEKSGEYGFAVKKGSSPELIQMFNNGLAALKKSGQYDKIINKYLSDKKKDAKSESSVDESTIFGLLSNNYKQLLSGLGTTLSLAILSFALAMIVGILFGMMSVSPYKTLRIIASIFVDVVRGIPLMIVAAFIFWGIPNLIESITGHQSPINDFVAGTIALTLNGGAYIAEIVRGGIEAVPSGQMEASRSLGISYKTTMKRIILPQAFKLMLPNFINQFVISLKDTTIISAIGLIELFQAGKIIIARNYQSFRMYAILAIMYLVIITLLTRLAKRLEKRIK